MTKPNKLEEKIKEMFEYTDFSGEIGRFVWVKKSGRYDNGEIEVDFYDLLKLMKEETIEAIRQDRERLVSKIEKLRHRYKSDTDKATKQIEVLVNLVIDEAIAIIQGDAVAQNSHN